MNDTTAPPSAADAGPATAVALVPRPSAAPPPTPGADAAPGRVRVAAPAGWAAVALAAVAVVLGWVAVQRAGDIDRRLAELRVDVLARDQQGDEREQRLDRIEREWSQAQGDAEVAGPAMSDADLRRRREVLALIDVERVVEQAQLQLRLGAPPAVAIDALQAVNARLDRLSSPAVTRVQQAVRHDLARLKSAPDLDRGQLAARLDPLLRAVDTWHASADALQATTHAPAPAAARKAPPPEDGGWGAQLRAWLAREFGDLVRIRTIDTPEALRLEPAQQQLLRDRVRLGLLDLREAVLARDERTIRAEVTGLDFLLTRYFDPNQPEVAAALAQLHAVVAAASGAASPSLDETLAALRLARGGERAGGA